MISTECVCSTRLMPVMPARAVTSRVAVVSLTAGAGVAAVAAGTVLAARSETLVRPAASAVGLGLFGTVYALSGAYSWWRRPGNRFGLVMCCVAPVVGAAGLSAVQSSWVYPLGRALVAAIVLYVLYILLSYPNGRLRPGRDRALMSVLAAGSVALWTAALLVLDRLPATGPTYDCGDACPRNGYDVAGLSGWAGHALAYVVDGVTIAGIVLTCAVLVGRLRAPSHLQRRALAPLVAVAIVWCSAWSTYVLLHESGVTGADPVLRPIIATVSVALPASMVLGQWGGRMFAQHGLVDFASALGSQPLTPAAVEGLMRDAVGDPTLVFLIWSREERRYVDVHGRPAEVPDEPDAHVVAVSRNGDGPEAAVSFDPHLSDSDPIVDGLARMSLLMLERDRLVQELGDSRARLATEAAAERLRLERDLHDGAQQQLFLLKLALAELRADVDPRAQARLAAAMAQADAAIDEIRQLSQGIYPSVLFELGLPAALGSLATRSPVPVELDDGGVGRSTSAIEHAVYLAVTEAVQNAAKHGGPGVRVAIALAASGEALEFTVADDGAGFDMGAAAGNGGLLNMTDRIGSVGGTLTITSAPGEGTTVRARVPGALRAVPA